MGSDCLVNLSHEVDSFVQGDDDSVAMLNIIGGQQAAFAVLEPLFADL